MAIKLKLKAAPAPAVKRLKWGDPAIEHYHDGEDGRLYYDNVDWVPCPIEETVTSEDSRGNPVKLTLRKLAVKKPLTGILSEVELLKLDRLDLKSACVDAGIEPEAVNGVPVKELRKMLQTALAAKGA